MILYLHYRNSILMLLTNVLLILFFISDINGNMHDDDDDDDDVGMDVGIRDDVFRQRQRQRLAA
jgi:hypothetical protein